MRSVVSLRLSIGTGRAAALGRVSRTAFVVQRFRFSSLQQILLGIRGNQLMQATFYSSRLLSAERSVGLAKAQVATSLVQIRKTSGWCQDKSATDLQLG